MTTFLTLITSGLLVGGVYGMLAQGFVVTYKCVGIFNIAYGQFAALGAFMAWTFMGSEAAPRLPVPVALLFTLLFAVVFGLVLERVIFRRALRFEPQMLMLLGFVLSLGVMGLLEGFTMFAWGSQPRPYPDFMPKGPLELGSVVLYKEYIVSFLVAMVLLLGFLYLFTRTKLGLGLRATSDNQQVAQSVGVNTKQSAQLAWILATVIGTTSGILLGVVFGVSPGLSMLTLTAMAVVILGGVDSFPGAVIGGLVLGTTTNLVDHYLESYMSGIGGIWGPVLIFTVLMIRPTGLLGTKRVERV